MLTVIRAFLIGVAEGRATIGELTSGLTFRYSLANEAYDRGVNLGLWLRDR